MLTLCQALPRPISRPNPNGHTVDPLQLSILPQAVHYTSFLARMPPLYPNWLRSDSSSTEPSIRHNYNCGPSSQIGGIFISCKYCGKYLKNIRRAVIMPSDLEDNPSHKCRPRGACLYLGCQTEYNRSNSHPALTQINDECFATIYEVQYCKVPAVSNKFVEIEHCLTVGLIVS